MRLVRDAFAGFSARRSTPRQSAPASSVVVPVSTVDRELLLVVGMQWHTILGSNLPAQARRKARDHGARYWVHAGGRAESVGTATMSRRSFDGRGGRLHKEAHSAAQIVALRHPGGVHALVLSLPDTRYWCVVVRDGQVVNRSDVVVHTTAEAARLVQQAQERFGNDLQLLGQAEELLLGHDALSPTSVNAVEEFTQLALDAGPRSVVRSRSALSAHASIAFVTVVVAVAVALAALRGWQETRRVTPASVTPHQVPSVADAEQRWRDALARLLRRTGTPTPDAMQLLWHEIGQLPVERAGWGLQSLRCREQGVPWHCDAIYTRSQAQASAAAFTAAASAEWDLLWQSFDEVSARFVIHLERQPLDLISLAQKGAGLIPDADALQAIRPLLRTIRVDDAREVHLEPPRNEAGVPIRKPASVPSVVTREITLQAPLRSFALLSPDVSKRVAWHEVFVQLRPRVQPTATTSVLMATLRGRSYETSL